MMKLGCSWLQAAQVPGQVLEGGHVPSVQPNNQTQQEVSVAQMQQGGTPAQQQQLTQYAQPVQNAAQHAASYTAHPGPQMQQAGLYVQHPGVYMPHPGMYMQSGSHLQQPGVYMQQPLTQTPPVAGQIQQPGVPLVAPIPAPLGTQMQPPILPLQGQALQSTPSTQLPQVVHSPLNYAMPGVMAHQVPTQARGQVQHITQPSQLPPLMPTPVGQQPMQQSSLSQPNQISSSRPGAYSSQSPQRQQPNLQQSQAHPRTPAQAATSQPQSLPQGPSQPSHTPHGTSSTPSVSPILYFILFWLLLGPCLDITNLFFCYVYLHFWKQCSISTPHYTKAVQILLLPSLSLYCILCCIILEIECQSFTSSLVRV